MTKRFITHDLECDLDDDCSCGADVAVRIEGDTMDIEVTQMPCGLDCGAIYSLHGLVDPIEIQRAALNDRWGIRQTDEGPILVCARCNGTGWFRNGK